MPSRAQAQPPSVVLEISSGPVSFDGRAGRGVEVEAGPTAEVVAFEAEAVRRSIRTAVSRAAPRGQLLGRPGRRLAGLDPPQVAPTARGC